MGKNKANEKTVKCLSSRIVTVFITSTVDHKSNSFLHYLIFLFKLWKNIFSCFIRIWFSYYSMLFKTITWRFWAVSCKDDYRMLLRYYVMLIFRPVIPERGSKLVLRVCICLMEYCCICSLYKLICFLPDKCIAVKGCSKYCATMFFHLFSQIIPAGLTWFREK